MSSYRALMDHFEKTKRELREAESTIRRITGRDPDEIASSASGSKFRPSASTSRAAKPHFYGRKRSFTMRRESKESSYEEESSDDEESPNKKPTLQSTVVAKKQGRSRTATIEEQNVNSKIKARNRRMFGALIGVLQKFQHEEKERQHKGSMRAEIEQKVEAATEEERERIKKEKETLFITRKEKQIQLRCLEKKMERAESHEVFEANQRHLQNYIMTKAKPPIFFLPASHTPTTKKALEDSKSKIQAVIKKHKDSLDTDLAQIDDWYKKDGAAPGEKENKLPKDEGESQDAPETESESLVIEQEDTGADDDDSNNTKLVGSLTDQEFEPIYD